MAWLVVLAVLVGLAVLPLGVRLRYGETGAFIWLLIGPIKKQLYSKSGDKPAKAKKEEKKETAKPQKADKEGGSLTDFLPLAKTAVAFLNELRRKLVVKNLELLVTMAGDDPCDLAENYGRACAALSAFEPQLERLVKIKRKNLQIRCDFLSENSSVFAYADIIISLGRLLFLLFRYGFRALREYINMKDQRKGGANL